MKKNFYKYIFLGALSCSIFTSNVFAFQKTDVSIKYNSLLQPIKTNIINKDGHTLVAFRDLFNILGANVSWNEVFRRVTARLGEDELIIYADTNEATFNKNKIEMPVGVEIIDGTTYIPVRFACETFGYNVEWDSAKKEISISDDYGEYILLDENQNEGETISLEDAMKKAKQNNSNLKNLEDTYSYLQKVRSSVSENLDKEDPYNLGSNAFPTEGQGSTGLNTATMDYLNNTLSTLRNIKSTENQIKNQEINKQIINDTIELSLITSVIAIKNLELNIISLEKSIEVGKINIENLEAKYKYGMTSEKDLNSAKTNQKSLESNLESLKLNLQTQQDSLKTILGTKKDVNIDVEINVDYKDVEKINLEEYVNKSIASDLSIQMIENDISVAQYNLDTNFNATTNEKTNLQNTLNTEQRKLNDAKENLAKKIRTAYANLQTFADKEKYLKASLKNSIDEYNIAVSNYKIGKITLYQVEQAKLAVLNAEKAIEENKLSFYSTLYTFSKPYLL